MPLYTFVCSTCENKFSKLTTPNREQICPTCGALVSEHDLPTASLIDTPGNFGRKSARQLGQKSGQLHQKHQIRK